MYIYTYLHSIVDVALDSTLGAILDAPCGSIVDSVVDVLLDPILDVILVSTFASHFRIPCWIPVLYSILRLRFGFRVRIPFLDTIF